MRVFSRSAVFGLLGAGLIGLVGCAENNESAVDKQAATATVSNKQGNITDQKQLLQKQQQQQSTLKSSGYPGAK